MFSFTALSIWYCSFLTFIMPDRVFNLIFRNIDLKIPSFCLENSTISLRDWHQLRKSACFRSKIIFSGLPKSISVLLITSHCTPLQRWSSTKGIRFFPLHLPCTSTDLITRLLLLLKSEIQGLPSHLTAIFWCTDIGRSVQKANLGLTSTPKVLRLRTDELKTPVPDLLPFGYSVINIISLLTFNEASYSNLFPDHIRLPKLLTRWCFRLRLPYPSCVAP